MMLNARLVLGSILIAVVAVTAAHLYATPSKPNAYAVAEINVTDPVAYQKYIAAVTPIVAQFGGTYIVRAGQVVPVEGDAPTGRFIVIQFPNMKVARQFERSAEYRAIAPLRQQAARTRLFLVEGVPNR